MNYTQMLNKLIDSTGLKNIEIIEKLKEKGVTITPNYLSVLKNDTTKIASDEVSKGIAEVCHAKYPDILIIQGQLDKLPESIRNFITLALETITASAISLAEQMPEGFAASQIEAVKQAVMNMSQAELICEILENKEYYAQTNKEIKEMVLPQHYAVIPISPMGHIKIVDENGSEVK
jgi:ethanolamine utilization cobalamin adenosyltransferase